MIDEVVMNNWRTIKKPRRLGYEVETSTDTYGKFIAQPLERGFGITIGNSLRRILLSSMQGAAATSIKIEGVEHEYDVLDSVREDVAEIILNVKRIRFSSNTVEPRTAVLSVSKKGPVSAGDITCETGLEVLNKDHHIVTLIENRKFEMEITVELGRGYVGSEKNKNDEMPIGIIPVDSIFSPVTRVAYEVENTRVGQMTEFDKLILEVWTDGFVKPVDSLAYAAKILKDHLDIFINFDEGPDEEPETVKSEERSNEHLDKSVEELELSVRSYNCLKAAEIGTIRDLVTKGEAEMLKYRNFGRKSLNEIKAILTSMGLRLGMAIDEQDPVVEEDSEE